jgi:hypothetical protein
VIATGAPEATVITLSDPFAFMSVVTAVPPIGTPGPVAPPTVTTTESVAVLVAPFMTSVQVIV